MTTQVYIPTPIRSQSERALYSDKDDYLSPRITSRAPRRKSTTINKSIITQLLDVDEKRRACPGRVQPAPDWCFPALTEREHKIVLGLQSGARVLRATGKDGGYRLSNGNRKAKIRISDLQSLRDKQVLSYVSTHDHWCLSHAYQPPMLRPESLLLSAGPQPVALLPATIPTRLPWQGIDTSALVKAAERKEVELLLKIPVATDCLQHPEPATFAPAPAALPSANGTQRFWAGRSPTAGLPTTISTKETAAILLAARKANSPYLTDPARVRRQVTL